MTPPGPRMRVFVLVCLTLAALAPVVWWSRGRGGPGYASPGDCLDAYCNAAKDGDAERCLACLAEPLRAETLRRFPDRDRLARHLRETTQDVADWGLHLEPGADGPEAEVEVKERRGTVNRRTRFQLARSARGWLITGIGQPVEEPVKPADDEP